MAAKIRYVIRCRVSGGVTGTRESLLKRDGVVRMFDDRAEAEAVARELNAKMNDIRAVARYWYGVVEISEEGK